MGKPTVCIYKSKGADQLRSSSSSPLFALHGQNNSSFLNFKLLAIFNRLVQVALFSHNAAHLLARNSEQLEKIDANISVK